jgi:large subunit ribosomal protein L17
MSYRKLGRRSDQRKALLRDLATDVIMYERIETTLPKAKEVRKKVERMITLGKKGDLASRRKAAAFLRNEEVDGKTVLKKLFEDVAPRYQERPGGYTRILKMGPRRGDNAEMAIIELV